MSLPNFRLAASQGVLSSGGGGSQPQTMTAGSPVSFNILKERLRSSPAASPMGGFLFQGGVMRQQDEIKANPFVHGPYGNAAFNPQRMGSKAMDYLDGIILPFESVEDTLIGQEQESLKEIEPSKVTEVPKKATGRPKGRKDSYKRVRRSPQEAIKQEKSETKARRGRPPGSKDLVKRKTPANIKPKAVRPPKKPKMTEKVMKPKGRPRGSKSTKPVDPEVLRIRREHRRQKLLSGEHKKPGPKPNPNRSKMFDSYVPAPWLSGLTPLWTKTWIIHNPFSQENKEMVVEHMAFLKTDLDRVGYRDPSLASKSQQNDLEAEDQSFFINHQACD